MALVSSLITWRTSSGSVDIPLRVLHALHKVGLHEAPPVNAGRYRRDELYWRDVESLPERRRRKLGEILRVAENVLAPPDAAALAAEVYTRLGSELLRGILRPVDETEALRVLVKLLLAHELADVHKGDVAGVLHRLGQTLRAVAAVFPALERTSAAQNVHAAAAVETGVLAHHALLERHGQSYYLESRTRLVCIGYRLVAPLQLLGQGIQLIVFLVRLRRRAYLGLRLRAYCLVIVEVEITK